MEKIVQFKIKTKESKYICFCSESYRCQLLDFKFKKLLSIGIDINTVDSLRISSDSSVTKLHIEKILEKHKQVLTMEIDNSKCLMFKEKISNQSMIFENAILIFNIEDVLV